MLFFLVEYTRKETKPSKEKNKRRPKPKKKKSLQKREKKKMSIEIEIYKYCQIHESHAFLSIYKNTIEQSQLNTKNWYKEFFKYSDYLIENCDSDTPKKTLLPNIFNLETSFSIPKFIQSRQPSKDT